MELFQHILKVSYKITEDGVIDLGGKNLSKIPKGLQDVLSTCDMRFKLWGYEFIFLIKKIDLSNNKLTEFPVFFQ